MICQPLGSLRRMQPQVPLRQPHASSLAKSREPLGIQVIRTRIAVAANMWRRSGTEFVSASGLTAWLVTFPAAESNADASLVAKPHLHAVLVASPVCARSCGIMLRSRRPSLMPLKIAPLLVAEASNEIPLEGVEMPLIGNRWAISVEFQRIGIADLCRAEMVVDSPQGAQTS